MYLIIRNKDLLAFESKRQAIAFLMDAGDKRWQCDIRELSVEAGAFVKSGKALSMQIKASKMEWASE